MATAKEAYMNELNTVVQARITSALRKKLRIYCQQHERSEAEAIRLMLKKFLKNISTDASN